VLYQPQIASWENQRRMVAYAAVSVESPGGQKPTLGTVKIEADTKVALDDRLVSFSDMALTEANLPELQKEQARDVVGQISKGLPEEDRFHEPSKTYYPLNDGSWLKTTDLKGSWAPASRLPESFQKLPDDDNFKDAKNAVPGKKLSASKAPKVFVSLVPAELVVIQGDPRYLLVDGTTERSATSTTSASWASGSCRRSRTVRGRCVRTCRRRSTRSRRVRLCKT
jgi:hypothetical protein